MLLAKLWLLASCLFLLPLSPASSQDPEATGRATAGFWHARAATAAGCDAESETCRAAAVFWEPTPPLVFFLARAQLLSASADRLASCLEAGAHLVLLTDYQVENAQATASSPHSIVTAPPNSLKSTRGLLRALLAAMDDSAFSEARRVFFMPSSALCAPAVLEAMQRVSHADPLQYGELPTPSSIVCLHWPCHASSQLCLLLSLRATRFRIQNLGDGFRV